MLALVLAFPCLAETKWIKATTTNFELLTTAGERRAREALLRFEQVRSFFLRASGSKPSAKGRVRIIAFQSDKEYRPYQLNEGTTAHAGGGRDHDEIVMSSITSEHYPVAVHEYVHILLKPLDNLPVWLNEGLADVYSTLTPVGNKVRVGDVPPGRWIDLQQAKWMDLDTLFQVDHQSPYYNDKEKRRVFYAESWALTHMLSLDTGYRLKFPELFRQIAAGTAPQQAFQKAFGKTLPEIWNDLREYMRRERLFAALFDIKLEKSAEQPEIQPATAFESGLALAGVLVDLQRVDDARKAYEQLARDNPKDPAVPEAVGYLEWRGHNRDAACAQFAKAVELGSRNPRLYFDYAGMLWDGNERRERQVPLLRKAVELDPTFRDARLNLAYVLMGQEDYKGALVQFAYIKNVESKEAFQFFYSLAYAYYRVDNKQAARESAARASQYAKTPSNQSTVAQLLEAMRDRPAPVQQAAAEPANESRPATRRSLLAREPAVAEPAVTPRSTVTGTLEHLECLRGTAIVRVQSKGHMVRLLLKDPSNIEIRGTGSGTHDFTCGPQKPVSVLVEYERAVDGKAATVGIIRAIEFQ